VNFDHRGFRFPFRWPFQDGHREFPFKQLSSFRTARSREEQTRNARGNANRNPEWWGDFSQLVKIETIRFLGISRYKFESRIWLNLNFSVSRSTNSNPDFGLIWICSCLKSPHHPGFRLAFRRVFWVSSSKEHAVPNYDRFHWKCYTSKIHQIQIQELKFLGTNWISTKISIWICTASSIWICTPDSVDFGGVVISVETVILTKKLSHYFTKWDHNCTIRAFNFHARAYTHTHTRIYTHTYLCLE